MMVAPMGVQMQGCNASPKRRRSSTIAELALQQLDHLAQASNLGPGIVEIPGPLPAVQVSRWWSNDGCADKMEEGQPSRAHAFVRRDFGLQDDSRLRVGRPNALLSPHNTLTTYVANGSRSNAFLCRRGVRVLVSSEMALLRRGRAHASYLDISDLGAARCQSLHVYGALQRQVPPRKTDSQADPPCDFLGRFTGPPAPLPLLTCFEG